MKKNNMMIMMLMMMIIMMMISTIAVKILHSWSNMNDAWCVTTLWLQATPRPAREIEESVDRRSETWVEKVDFVCCVAFFWFVLGKGASPHHSLWTFMTFDCICVVVDSCLIMILVDKEFLTNSFIPLSSPCPTKCDPQRMTIQTYLVRTLGPSLLLSHC